MSARVLVGYLLLELFNRRAILTEASCASLVKRVISPPVESGTAHDFVFAIGSGGRDLLRLCAPNLPLRYLPSQFLCSPDA